jgi:hypothetical protein
MAPPRYRPSSSEFPNDNPALRKGALRIGTELNTPLPIEETELFAELFADSPNEPPACDGPLDLDVHELAPVEHVVVELIVSAPETETETKPIETKPIEAEPIEAEPVEGAPALLEALLDPTESQPVTIPPPEPEHAAAPEPTPAPAPAPVAAPAPVPAPSPAAEGTPFARFADAVIDVAKSYMSARLAQKTRDILLEGDPGCDLDEECREALGRAHVLEGDALSDAFTAARAAFHALLEGDSSDMNGCGEQTLDQWATDLIATLAERPNDAAAIRRALRKHKVAAFGMLD